MHDTPPIHALLIAALRDSAGHMSRVMRLARMETDANLRAWIRLAAILGTIPVLAVVTFFLGLDALVKMIAALTGAPLVSAIIVAAPFIAVTLALAWIGTRRMALSNLEPWRTWQRAGRPTGSGPTRPAP